MEGLLMDNIDGKLFDSLPAKVQFCILEYIIDSALRQGYAFQVQCLLEMYEIEELWDLLRMWYLSSCFQMWELNIYRFIAISITVEIAFL